MLDSDAQAACAKTHKMSMYSYLSAWPAGDGKGRKRMCATHSPLALKRTKMDSRAALVNVHEGKREKYFGLLHVK